MSSDERKEKLGELIAEYKSFKEAGKLDLTSEETIRTWLNPFLEIFGWDAVPSLQRFAHWLYRRLCTVINLLKKIIFF